MSNASRTRGRARELRYAEHLEEAEGGLARRFESGCFDIVWLRLGHRPALIQVKSTVTPWAHFGPAARAKALAQAEQADAEPVLVWWPKGRNILQAEWIPATDWPK